MSPSEFYKLTENQPGSDYRAERGYIIDEWKRWQQGGCGTYALALTQIRPGLRFGTLYDGDWETHHFAHDDEFAYDSAGRHHLPYLGLDPDNQATHAVLDDDHNYYGVAQDSDPAETEKAKVHILRHGIGINT